MATSVVGSDGLVVSCDLLDIEPVSGAVVLPGSDFTLPHTWRHIRHVVGNTNIDLVLSDMAPNVSGQVRKYFTLIT